MKYFTPKRYLRLGNLKNERAFLAAQADWERAIAGYTAHLRRIRASLPISLVRLVDSVYLHDARVLGIWQGPRSRFTVTLQPESDPSRLAILAYSLIEPARFNHGALPADVQSEPVTWLYDELDVDRSSLRQAKNRGRIARHDILLSNGWEIGLRFRKVKVSHPAAVLPTWHAGAAAAVGVARSA